MAVDAEHRSLVDLRAEQARTARVHPPVMQLEEDAMARGLLLWMIGVPIPVIILLWLFFGR
ncbi:hypothetical protein [Bradyrhizobium sp. I71]|uniref:hypothetical protein n=1 Tax=Bradyrhizobium sp. I71 TaxID=2590772 RepID=UPI001EF76375|nr:hypothetical protein [Bradyrhizobium sp. I71]ULK94907.1 hypothetical protein FJV43_34890 [Bradyrhizobium sp. I71]